MINKMSAKLTYEHYKYMPDYTIVRLESVIDNGNIKSARLLTNKKAFKSKSREEAIWQHIALFHEMAESLEKEL
jgi:hypothetical protein